jgi:AraC family transcriptional regulator
MGDNVAELCSGYGLFPSGQLAELPTSRVSMVRFTQAENTLSKVVQHHSSSYTLALILKPMKSHAWRAEQRFWSGAIPANSVNVVPPEVTTRWRADGAFDLLFFLMPPDLLQEAAGRGMAAMTQNMGENFSRFFRDDIVSQLGRLILNASISDRPNRLQFADGISHALVAHLLDRFLDEGSRKRIVLSPSKVQKVTRYIRDHLAGTVTNAELAAVAGLSESHFAQGFRTAVGEPPHFFINSLRIEQACELLKRDRTTLHEIAIACGFADVSHLGRVFRARMGVTPRQYRLAH